MKKRNISSLTLNKRKISELQERSGGAQQHNADQITMSTCSCVTCIPTYCPTNPSLTCPPKPTELCTMDCTLDCTFLGCGITGGTQLP